LSDYEEFYKIQRLKIPLVFIARAAVLILFGFLEEGKRIGDSRSSHSARAAFDFRNTVGIFADKFALGFGAVWFVAFPVTLWLFAYGLALGFRSLAVSNAVRSFAYSDTLWAVEQLASLVRALDFTLRLFAFDVANGVFGFSARCVAFRRLANWVTDCRAMGIIAFPRALGMALKY
jgi:hypothetical protein